MNLAVIKKPLVTEKGTSLATTGQYLFEVAIEATKPEVKKAVQKIYGVHVTTVHMITLPSKSKRYRGKRYPERGRKKAIVTLKKGEQINF